MAVSRILPVPARWLPNFVLYSGYGRTKRVWGHLHLLALPEAQSASLWSRRQEHNHA